MAPHSKVKRPAKPTVFLSHSSNNRRELSGLKRLLDQRAGGLIDFFLSSDDDSIAHGTIWPAEVRAALDRMSLMLIFVSSEALKSGWTYFEAGYGLHKLNSAKIYCLPGSDKGSLPSPFNILQNRNLHSAKDISLLIKQCNEELGASLAESVSQEEFERIFKKPLTVRLETGPSFERLVRNVTISTKGPANGAEIFSEVCRKKGFAVSAVPEEDLPRTAQAVSPQDVFFSTGLRLSIERPELTELEEELPIKKEDLDTGTMRIMKYSYRWETPNIFDRDYEDVPIKDVKAYNAKIRKTNQETNRQNELKLREPRECNFELAPTNISVPLSIIDDWVDATKVQESVVAEINLNSEVQRELRTEAITAKMHGSDLSYRQDGSYNWNDYAIVDITWSRNKGADLKLRPTSQTTVSPSTFHVQELVFTLFELGIISLSVQRPNGRRK